MSATSPQRFPLLAAGIFGATGVALGALGAHRLQPLLAQRGMAQVWETGSRYHLMHAIALLGIAAWVKNAPAGPATSRLIWAAWCWSVGIVLFAGSLYWFSVGGPFPLVYVTPVGGIALLVGWLFVIAAALKPAKANPS